LFACVEMISPVVVEEKRFLALLFVFNFGIYNNLLTQYKYKKFISFLPLVYYAELIRKVSSSSFSNAMQDTKFCLYAAIQCHYLEH
jgi:hypothetical protein